MKWLLPPILWAFCMIAIILNATLRDNTPLIEPPFSYAGVLLVIPGIWLLLHASGLFRAIGTNINTFRDPDTLVTTGPFAFTRNPMYLGFFLTLAGAAIIAGAGVIFLYALIFFTAANYWYIPFEEKAAEKQFGEDYLNYKKRVRRWL